MKPLFFACLAFSFALTVAAATASGSDSPEAARALALGEELFFDPNVGGSTNSWSCNTCHGGGAGLGSAADLLNPKQAVRYCVSNRMGGILERKDWHVGALTIYVLSFSGVEGAATEPEAPVSPKSGPLKGWEKNNKPVGKK